MGGRECPHKLIHQRHARWLGEGRDEQNQGWREKPKGSDADMAGAISAWRAGDPYLAVPRHLSNWCPRQESNLHLRLRRSPFCPLNYGGVTMDFLMAASAGVSCTRQVQITSIEFSRPLCARTVKRWAMR